jgi:hypothetical protein
MSGATPGSRTDHLVCGTCGGWWAERDGVRIASTAPFFGQAVCACATPTRPNVVEVTRIDSIVIEGGDDDDGDPA